MLVAEDTKCNITDQAVIDIVVQQPAYALICLEIISANENSVNGNGVAVHVKCFFLNGKDIAL